MSVNTQMCLATVWLTNFQLSSGIGSCFLRHIVRISCGPASVYPEAKQQRMKITTHVLQLRTKSEPNSPE